MLDDALVRWIIGVTTLLPFIRVSILVVLDDALVRINVVITGIFVTYVSILVVLDDALVQAIGLANALAMGVSILVVLDDALVHIKFVNIMIIIICLNPCCAGRCSST